MDKPVFRVDPLAMPIDRPATLMERRADIAEAETRYHARLVMVIEVIDAQRTALRADREALAVKGAQLASTGSLVKALGAAGTGASPERRR